MYPEREEVTCHKQQLLRSSTGLVLGLGGAIGGVRKLSHLNVCQVYHMGRLYEFKTSLVLNRLLKFHMFLQGKFIGKGSRESLE